MPGASTWFPKALMIKVLWLVLLAEIWNTAGQILFKKSANALEAPHLKNLQSYLSFLKSVFSMPAIWLGLGAMGLGLWFWLRALAQSDLSVVFPLGSVQYILTLAAAGLFLGEKMDRLKIAGTLLVTAGIVLIALS